MKGKDVFNRGAEKFRFELAGVSAPRERWNSSAEKNRKRMGNKKEIELFERFEAVN